jgi:flagellar biosynthesis protein FliQ
MEYEWTIVVWLVVPSFIVGFVMAYLQSVFQIDDPVLSLIPKFVVVGLFCVISGKYYYSWVITSIGKMIINAPVFVKGSW